MVKHFTCRKAVQLPAQDLPEIDHLRGGESLALEDHGAVIALDPGRSIRRGLAAGAAVEAGIDPCAADLG